MPVLKQIRCEGFDPANIVMAPSTLFFAGISQNAFAAFTPDTT